LYLKMDNSPIERRTPAEHSRRGVWVYTLHLNPLLFQGGNGI